MIKGEYILGIGIIFDLITTFIGTNFFGLTEGNTLGLLKIYVAGLLLLGVATITINYKLPEWVDYIFYILGGFRFAVGLFNLFLILTILF